MLVAGSIATADAGGMPYGTESDPKDGVPLDIKRTEGAALHKLWKRYAKRSQAAFLATLDLSPGYFPQFFSGQRPLTLKLAVAIASELDVEIVEFSPRLAKEMDKALEASGWPFKRFSQADYASLTKAQKDAVEAFVVAYLPETKASSSRKFPRLV